MVVDARSQLPALSRCVHLNTAGAGPQPHVSLAAITAAVEEDAGRPRMSEQALDRMDQRRGALRAGIARLLGVAHEEIAITPGVTAALNAVVAGIDWRPGDEVITTSHEHPALSAPLQVAAERHGVAVHVIELERGDEPLADAVRARAGTRTRLIALSHVSWINGAVLDVAGAAAAAREVGALVLVDGAQAAGALPVAVGAMDVDAYAVNASKWTLGPQGLGALWVSPAAAAHIRPSTVGIGSGEMRDGSMHWHEDARRYEPGALPEPLLPGWTASLAWLEQVGMERVAADTARNVAAARQMLDGIGAEMLSPAGPSGIVTFRLRHIDPQEAVPTFEGRGIILRWVPSPRAFRASVAFFTNDDDLAALVTGLAGLPG